MMTTRSQAASLKPSDMALKIKNLQDDLIKSQKLNERLFLESKDSETEFASMINKNTVLKNELAEQDIELQDACAERDTLRTIVVQYEGCHMNYESMLLRNKELEDLVEKLQEELELASSGCLCCQLLKNEQLRLQERNFELLQTVKANIPPAASNVQTTASSTQTETPSDLKQTVQYSSLVNKKRPVRKDTKPKMTQKCVTGPSLNLVQGNNQTKRPNQKKVNKVNLPKQASASNSITIIPHNVDDSNSNRILSPTPPPQPSAPTKKIKKHTKKMLIISDEYGRHLSQTVHQHCSVYDEITAICKPQAPLSELIRDLPKLTMTLGKGDALVLIASNGELNNHKKQYLEGIAAVQTLCSSNNIKLFVSSLIYRSAKRTGCDKMYCINNAVYDLLAKCTNIVYLDFNCYDSSYFTYRGLFNTRGLTYLCNEIVSKKNIDFKQNIIYVATSVHVSETAQSLDIAQSFLG